MAAFLLSMISVQNLKKNALSLPPDKPLCDMNQDALFIVHADAEFPLQRHLLKSHP